MIAEYGVNTLKNFSFFGHSMGAIVAYEIAVNLLERYGTKVNYLFLSSKSSPDHKMDKVKGPKTLIDQLKEIGGINEEILETDDFMNVFLPIIKSDFDVLEGYHIKSFERKKLDSKAVLLLGSKDIVKKDSVVSWSQYIKYIKELYLIEGDHFYLNNNQDTVMAILQKYLIEKNYKLPIRS
ncbi:thioesterase II family protein [Oceanobacillus alkalisoli]|uniref:thioesterase II family protein n=1 Tax=Oceanobacillus alkalisoli TaxID=2925113 RepID=UPI001F11AEB8|nr:thioesterase domain-containing protein [Oceanobacillus alkalisoli]MCF3941534.1 thioesterase domain-containing protein [Oceanobacillus alkalisoli]